MTKELAGESNLHAPRLPEAHRLTPILAAALKQRPAPRPAGETPGYWPAAYFHLDQVSFFRETREETRQHILAACSRSILAEAYYIEKSGMYFAAKMALLAETTEERMLYSLFGADEATHFSWIGAYVNDGAAAGDAQRPFIQLLDEALRSEGRETLCYLVQVILEGWGIAHYRALAAACCDAGLRAVLENILKDEGRHHASGVVLSRERTLSAAQFKRLVEIVVELLRLVQAGPQTVVAHLEQYLGGLSRAQRVAVFSELNCEADTAHKLGTLQSLINSAGHAERLFAELARRGSFRPFTAAECAALS